MTTIAGLDVGGAHLKVALVAEGIPTRVEQFVCPLWQGIDKLDAALAAAAPLLSEAGRFAVTMTGELSDFYPDRDSGVRDLAARLVAHLGGDVQFFSNADGSGIMVSADTAHRMPHHIGSMNFLATAQVAIARLVDRSPRHVRGLLVDFGSTTADIIALDGGKPAMRGLTDGERQQTGELVYTGYTRTAVMGVAQVAPFKGNWVTLAREYLATMADVRRILGELDAAVDLHATADGRGKSLDDSVTRLARMLGRDAREGTLADWQIAARYIADVQLRSIHDGALQVLSAAPNATEGPLVAAGIGAEVATALAVRLSMPSVTFGALVGAPAHVETAATHHAAAVAVALIAAHTAQP